MARRRSRQSSGPPPHNWEETRDSSDDLALSRGLPSNLDAEKFTLGSVLLDQARFTEVASVVTSEDFSMESHRRIFRSMMDLAERGEKIDRVTVANDLVRKGHLESVGGLTYLVSLDDGLPHISNLDAYTRIVREKAALRRIIFTSQKAIDDALMAEEESSSIAMRTAAHLTDLGHIDSSSLLNSWDAIATEEGGINQFFSASSQAGMSTGFIRLDDMTGGLYPGTLTVIGGRPSSGKSSLIMNIATHIAIGRGKPVVVFTLESKRRESIRRAICAMADMDLHRMKTGRYSADERLRLVSAVHKLKNAVLVFDDTGSLTVLDIHDKCRKLERKHGPLGMVAIDHLQLMTPHESTRREFNRVQEISVITRYLKIALAKQLNCPVVALSQLSRSPEIRKGDHRPQLSDLRDGGSLEQDADNVFFVFRPEVYQKNRDDLKGKAELIIAKQRDGPIGVVNLIWRKEYVRFDNRAEDIPQGVEVAS